MNLLRLMTILYALMALLLVYIVSPYAPPGLGPIGTVVSIALVLGGIPLIFAQITARRRADPSRAKEIQTQAILSVVGWVLMAGVATWIITTWH